MNSRGGFAGRRTMAEEKMVCGEGNLSLIAAALGGVWVMRDGSWRIPREGGRATRSKPGRYDARRLRSQREVIRDVMLAAADCEHMADAR